MKLLAAFALLIDLRAAIQAALLPTLYALWLEPLLLLRPTALSRTFMAYVWAAFADVVDEGGREVKADLITPNATGIVLDIGAGHGHTINYLDRSKITKYVALEPNTLMHHEIRARATEAGYSETNGTLLILSCGAEDTESIISSLRVDDQPPLCDTIVSVLTLCSVPRPEEVLTTLARDVLKPGGQLLFYEHVLSPRSDVAWWQRFWTPVWKTAFDGCRLDRPTHLWVQNIKPRDDSVAPALFWRDESRAWGKPGEPEEHLFWHQTGRFVKA
ncbi:hypothetical protein HGRIS_010969 [Hohenbuehelia grisea]|uniref:S-adenosyl-L-methionine-dependent methyltransferase n=1 Tax=Hohenbuehelia grisea TaxID=104357 RepID=A0ABR3IYG3_9AGAR